MPTYDYRCRDCGHEFEIQQSFADDALTECPQCAGSLRKVFGNVGISFKGSGFYKNDSRSGSGSKTPSSSSSSSSSESNGSSSSSSESTSASSSSDSSTSGSKDSGSKKESTSSTSSAA
jgi:putative FmdB family regulatory protein